MRDYFIPTNFKDSGYIFNGMIAVRNAIDAFILGLIGYIIASCLPFSGDGALSGYILIIGLFVMLGISGVKGIPVSVFVVDAIRWRGRRKPFLYNHHGTAFTMTAAELMLSEPQFRNQIADILDKMRNSLTSRKMDYIEGETFRFADDPELEALRYAEEQLQEENADPEEPAREEAEQIPEEKPHKPDLQKAQNLDFNQIYENITLHDTEGE